MIKKSISLKIFFIFLCLMLFILGIGWFIVEYFLEDYYQNKKVETMKKLSYKIEENMFNPSVDINDYLDSVSEAIGGRIFIADLNGRIRYRSGFRGFGSMGMGMGMGMGNMRSYDSIIDGNREAYLYKTTNHMGTMEWLVYKKETNQNSWIFIQIPFESIQEAVEIIQSFYIYIIMVMVILAVILALIFSKFVTKPLVKLNSIVNKMKDLDFNIVYEDNREDEIGQLGKNFNLLMNKLSQTIKQLQQELNKEKNLEKMRKGFVAQVSHELQTPITVIQGYVEALQDHIWEDESEKEFYYSIIQDETGKMSRIVKDLLDLSQLESGTFKINKEPFEFISFINEIYEKYRFICEEKGILFIKEFNIREVWIQGDEIRLEQVITNLIQNAIRHTKKENTICITVKEEENHILFCIFNEGSHIPNEDIPYIWDSFYKGIKNERKEGTGLGLAIAKNILELHQSQYWIKNVENGVEVFFILNK